MAAKKRISDQAREHHHQSSGALLTRCEEYERHVATLLGYLSSIAAYDPKALSETTRLICEGIARDTGNDMRFMPPLKKEG